MAKFGECKARARRRGELLICRRKVGRTEDAAAARSRRAIVIDLEEDTAWRSHRLGICIRLCGELEVKT